MKALTPLLLIVGMVGCGGDPDKNANELFVESVQLINSADTKEGDAAIADYEQALANRKRIIDEYSGSGLAVELVSGRTILSGRTLLDAVRRLRELKEEQTARRVRELKEEQTNPQRIEAGSTIDLW